GRSAGERNEPDAAHGIPEWTPALAHLRQQLAWLSRHGGKELFVMLGVVPVAVAGDDGDHPVVVGVELFGRELLDLGHEGAVCLVELAPDVAAIAAPRSLDEAHRALVAEVEKLDRKSTRLNSSHGS